MTDDLFNLYADARPFLEDCARVHDWTLQDIIPWYEEDFLVAAGVCTTPEGDCRLMTVKVKNAD